MDPQRQSARRYVNGRKRDRQFEAASARTSRVQIKHPADGRNAVLVRVPETRHRLRIFGGPGLSVHVASDHGHRSDARSASMMSGRPMSPPWMM